MPASLRPAVFAALLFTIAATALLCEAKAEAESIPLFAENATTATLDNGLDIVVIPDTRAPVVTHMLWYRVGAADEPPGKSGIAHFLEHLMFKGTETYPDGQFSKIVGEIGGQENAFTAQDYTGYFQRVAKEHLGLMMELEADRMTNLVLSEDAVATEREVILEERRSRIDNNPGSRLSEALTAAFYKNHPYGIPIIGWEQEMRGLTREDAFAFYRQHYSPENAILVVAGDVTAETVLELAEATYGKIPARGPAEARSRPGEPAHMAERRVILADDRVRQPSLQRAYLVPSYATAAPGEAEALDLLAEILGGGSTSRLYRALVVEQGIAASAGSWYQSSALDETRIGVWGTPREGVTLEELEAAVDGVIADFLETGVSVEELTRIRNGMMANAIYAQDSQATLARAFGTALTSGETVQDVQEWPRRIAAVTPEAIMDVARRYLRREGSATGYLIRTPADSRS